jgi:nitrate/nitrite transporter NarK
MSARVFAVSVKENFESHLSMAPNWFRSKRLGRVTALTPFWINFGVAAMTVMLHERARASRCR